MKLCSAALLVVLLSLGSTAEPVIQDGLKDWYAAAQTGRADILIIGDSVVLHGGHGWDAGIQAGFGQTTGLAGTGYLAGRSAGQGEGYAAGGTFGSAWSSSADDAFGSSDDRPLGQLTTTGGGILSVLVNDAGPLDPAAAYNYQVWAASGEDGGSFAAQRRLGQPPWNNRKTFSTTLVPGTGATDLYEFSFDQNSDPASEFRITSADNVTISGQRLMVPGATGVTVTSWGYGGRSTLDFYQDQYTARSELARETLLQRLVEGGSGKLLVMVMEGFNDRNETEVSLGGTLDGDSPQAFIENVSGLVDLIGEDWTDAGFDIADLSFLTFGMYDIAQGNDELDEYRQALLAHTAVRSDLSYIDLSAGQPDFGEGFALGYYADGIHLSRDGALHYGQVIAQTLEDSAATLVGDYNADGFVSQADLDLVLLNWGQSTLPDGWVAVDQFDGVAVSQNELDGVLLNWGNGTPLLVVPEPASGLYVLLLAFASLRKPARS